jgi:hypothetical protein
MAVGLLTLPDTLGIIAAEVVSPGTMFALSAVSRQPGGFSNW